MKSTLAGLHHVTAITADAQKNIDFYCGVLGLRLVKLTVNFDDPNSYHLYYGDELGRPGTIMTFFAWPGASRSRVGPPQVTATAFAVPSPSTSMDYWASRLEAHGAEPADRLGNQAIRFTDPDGMTLEIVAVPEPAGQPWTDGSVPVEHAIRGFHSVTISLDSCDATAKVLTELMGFIPAGSEGNRFRFRGPAADGFASTVDLLSGADAPRGGLGAGIVHHVAFRTPDDPQQLAWQTKIANAGLSVSPVMDRSYFHSIYYREPGGVLFEIATENPGFTADEPKESLGTKLMLPAQYERHRAEIERVLPKVRLPGLAKA